MNKFKRIVSLAMVLCMIMAFLPVGVSATEGDIDAIEPVIEAVDTVLPEPEETAEPTAEELEERSITVGVGGTATDTIIGGEYTADETDLDQSIATVDVAFEDVVTGTGEPEKASTLTSGGTYIIGNGSGRYMVVNGTSISSTQNFEDATEFTVTGSDGNWKIQTGSYYLRHGSNSLTVSATNSNNTWSYDGTRFYYTVSGNWGSTTTYRLSTNSSGTWRVNTDSSSRQGAAYTVTPATTPATTVTFTGVKVGVTYVTVGNVRYTINVVAEDLSKVQPLTVEFWITNVPVTAGGDTEMDISAESVHSAAGKAIAGLVPAMGTANGNDMAYWKATRLDSRNHQLAESGVNKTMAGTDFAYIRYYGGSWAYSADGRTWTNVVSGDQIVAYYMQCTKVTDEVTTQVVDWGEPFGNYWNDGNYILVDYAVKYESGERTPNAFPIRETTQKFHCSSDSDNISYGNVVRDNATGVYYRNLWYVRPVATEEYEVYMITLTPTADNAKTYLANTANGERENQANFYAGTEKVVWVDDRSNLGDFADESLHYTSISGEVTLTVGGEPGVPQLEIYNRHGMLVTYYVRAKATEDALTVHYVDKTEGVEFYSYNIAVKSGTYFHNGIALNTANPNGNLLNGTVTNFHGRTQTVSADLNTLSQVGAQYLYSEYECVEVKRSEDGKHVYLYYTFDPTVSYVIDFGLPMELTAADLSEKLAGVTIQDIAFSGSSYTTYGQLIDNGKTVTYKPVKVMNGMDYFTLLVTTDTEVGGILDDASKKIAFRVYIVPATTVHYEESFITLNGFEIEGTANAGNQETELAGAKKVNYGYTAAYTRNGATNGTEAVSVIDGTAANAEAEFTFTGDGVEVYVNAAKDTGTLLALFHQNKNGSESLTRLYQVDTAAQSGSSAVTGGQGVNSYNLPVISINGLDYGTYRIKLMHTGAGDELGKVRLDGFRVFNPLGNPGIKSYDADEQKPAFVEVRDEVLTALNVSADQIDDQQHFVSTIMSQVFAFTEGALNGALMLGMDKTVDVADLLNNGPKNELFLRKGESVSFDVGSAKAQIGLKALNGTVSYTVNGKGGSIATSADMFYGEYTGKVTIVNTGDNILSVTKLKLFSGTGTAALEPISEELVTHALQCMGIIEKPVNPFADVSADSYYYDAVLWAAKNGIAMGTDASHFLPEAQCQRAAVVTFLWRAAGSPEPETTVNPFVDVSADRYFYKAVLWALENGITMGVDESHFAPYEPCSRAQVVTFLWRAEGSPASSAVNPFEDVAEGKWYYEAILWAVENAVTQGVGANVFGVESTCNRAQIVTFLYRAQ